MQVAEQAVAEQAVAEQAVAEQAVAEQAVAEQAVAELGPVALQESDDELASVTQLNSYAELTPSTKQPQVLPHGAALGQRQFVLFSIFIIWCMPINFISVTL